MLMKVVPYTFLFIRTKVLEDCTGKLVIQDPFQLDFCVTKAYQSDDWKDMCKVTHSIICLQAKANLLDIFDKIERVKVQKKKKSRKSPTKIQKMLKDWEEMKKRYEQILDDWKEMKTKVVPRATEYDERSLKNDL